MSQLMTVARPYAEAAFSYASEHGQAEVWAEFLEALGNIAQQKDIQRLYHSPKIDRSDLLGLLAALTQVKEGSSQANFMQLLIEKKRLTASAEIAKRYVLLQHEAQDILDLYMTTAVSLNDTEKQGYAKKFTDLLQRKVVLHCATNKDIIGGFILRYGDKVIDSSIAGQLQKLSDCLIG